MLRPGFVGMQRVYGLKSMAMYDNEYTPPHTCSTASSTRWVCIRACETSPHTPRPRSCTTVFSTRRIFRGLESSPPPPPTLPPP